MNALLSAILAYVTIWQSPVGPVYVEHVRRAGGTAWAELVAEETSSAAKLAGVSEWTMLAIVASESGFDPWAHNEEDGTRGPFQLHPRSPWGVAARAECRARGLEPWCLTGHARWAALALRDGLEQCANEREAIGFYKSGKCLSGPQVARVLRIRADLRGSM